MRRYLGSVSEPTYRHMANFNELLNTNTVHRNCQHFLYGYYQFVKLARSTENNAYPLPTWLSIFESGPNTEITTNPTMVPSTTIKIGSITEVSPATVVSTSFS